MLLLTQSGAGVIQKQFYHILNKSLINILRYKDPVAKEKTPNTVTIVLLVCTCAVIILCNTVEMILAAPGKYTF